MPKSPLYKVSLAHVLALISPAVSVIAATLATWLVAHLHFLSTFHIGASSIAQAIAQSVIWGVTAIGAFLIQHKFLGGMIEIEKVQAQARAAAVAAPAPVQGLH